MIDINWYFGSRVGKHRKQIKLEEEPEDRQSLNVSQSNTHHLYKTNNNGNTDFSFGRNKRACIRICFDLQPVFRNVSQIIFEPHFEMGTCLGRDHSSYSRNSHLVLAK